MKTNPLIIALLVFVGLMCMNSCTKVSTGSLCGKVVLENDSEDPANDPVDYSGITVALYEIPELDTTITRINTEYPQTGVQISTETSLTIGIIACKIYPNYGDGSFNYRY